jgi:hypothetical protein
MSYKGPKTTLVCKGCGDTLEVRASCIRRNFDERPGYFLCNVCVRTYKHERDDGEILLCHYPSIDRFTAYTVRRASEEEAAAVLRAKALLARAMYMRTLN